MTNSLMKVCAIAVVLAVAGCGERKVDKKVATQVAAKVNGSEISVHQINAIIGKAQGVTAENADMVRKEILDKLIEQQLAYDQAIEKKLERSPDVMMAIEGAKREIVARAYLEQLTGALPAASDDDVAEYFKANPALFSARKVYRLQELSLAKDEAALAYVRQAAASGRPLEEMLAWLKAHQVAAAMNTLVKPAEQLPLDILPRLHEARDGQNVVYEAAPVATVWRVLATQDANVSLDGAKERIRQFLQNQKMQKAVTDDIKRMKSAAKIEYQGEFAAGAAAANAAAKPATAAAQPAPAAAGNMEKGVAGLK